ncbi:MAG: hybrid sensor histidine kinase/response regulator [Planctomycetota bacterium]
MQSVDTNADLAQPTHILVVEDDPPQRDLIEVLLQENSGDDGVEVLFAQSLVETLDLLSRLPIDAVLLDLTLPDSRGTVTFQAVCENFPTVPVIVLTDNPSETLSQDALAIGAQDFLSKDDALDEKGLLLSRTVTHSIERMRAQRRLLEAEREITARRYAAEIQRLREQSLLGEMVAIMSQKLAQPLSAITSYEATLRSTLDLDKDPNTVTLLDSIQRESQSAIELVRQMRSRIRTPRQSVEMFDVGDVLQRVISNLRECGREMEAALRFSAPAEAMRAKGDPFQIEQMFLGLISNGLEAVQSRGADGIVSLYCRLRNQEIVVEIDDNGPPLEEEIIDKLGEPFFTTKPDGVGVGMGISMARSVVELHGGLLTFQRREFRGELVNGLRVCVRLPSLQS